MDYQIAAMVPALFSGFRTEQAKYTGFKSLAFSSNLQSGQRRGIQKLVLLFWEYTQIQTPVISVSVLQFLQVIVLWTFNNCLPKAYGAIIPLIADK